MDIVLIKQTKKQCESEIRAIIYMFEQGGECIVDRLNILREYSIGGTSKVVDITMDIKIE